MACPPGTILNPRTLRCVRASGRTAHQLVRQGNVPDYYAQAAPAPAYADTYAYAVAHGPAVAHRKTVRKARPHTLAEAFGAAPTRHRQPAGPRLPVACPPGHNRNPATGRCIKLGGKTHKRLYPPPAPVVDRRASSEGPTRLPAGSAGVAPLMDKPTILGWASSQCKNNRDPITGEYFASADGVALQDLIRLHDRTCVMSGPLGAKIAAEHKAGLIAKLPGDSSSHLTLDDFRALRDSRRRHEPGYKIPARKHQPPPPNWQLYVASDNRSGSSFASVLFVDTAKVIDGPAGPEYPADSVVIDLGFIPLNVTGALCSPQMVVELLQRLTAANRLLIPVAGGWKPTAGFPYTKKYWATDTKERFGKLCRELTKALTTPL